MSACMFIRTKEYMKKHHKIEKRACLYGAYCKHWKNCIETHDIEHFTSPRINALIKVYSNIEKLRSQKKAQKEETHEDKNQTKLC